MHSLCQFLPTPFKKVKGFKVCIRIFILMGLWMNSFAYANWLTEAKKLSGESDSIREQAILQLKNIPDLEMQFKKLLQRAPASNAEQSLALDVISTLHLKSLWSDLLRFSEKDGSGMSYLAIISLTDKSNHLQTKKVFLERLNHARYSPVVKMILLDALLRMKQPVSQQKIKDFLGERSSPEVRSAALYYIRGMVLRENYKSYLPLLKTIDPQKYSLQFQTQLNIFLKELESVPHAE